MAGSSGGGVGVLALPSIRFLRAYYSLIVFALVWLATLAVSSIGTVRAGDAGKSASEDGSGDGEGGARGEAGPCGAGGGGGAGVATGGIGGHEYRGSFIAGVSGVAGQDILFVSVGVFELSRGLPVLANEMRRRGHRVQVVVPKQSLSIARVTYGFDIPLVGVGDGLSPENLLQNWVGKTSALSPVIGVLLPTSEFALPLAEDMMRDMIHLGQLPVEFNPDIVVADRLAYAAFDYADLIGKPLIVNHPGLVGSAPFEVEDGEPPPKGNLVHGASERTKKFLVRVSLLPSFMRINKRRWELKLPVHRGYGDVLGRRITLYNSHPHALDSPSSLSSSSIQTGPLISQSAMPLLESQMDALDSLRPGSALFNIGLTFLFRHDLDELAEEIERAKIDSWWLFYPKSYIPSVNTSFLADITQSPRILSHPNIGVAVVPCSLDAVLESLFYGKPVVCISVLEEHLEVARRLEETGAGLGVRRVMGNSRSLGSLVVSGIRKVTRDQDHFTNARLMAESLRMNDGVREAGDVIEAALVSGIEHLIPRSRALPLHQELSVDIYATYASIAIVIAALLRFATTVLLEFTKSSARYLSGRLPKFAPKVPSPLFLDKPFLGPSIADQPLDLWKTHQD